MNDISNVKVHLQTSTGNVNIMSQLYCNKHNQEQNLTKCQDVMFNITPKGCDLVMTFPSFYSWLPYSIQEGHGAQEISSQ